MAKKNFGAGIDAILGNKNHDRNEPYKANDSQDVEIKKKKPTPGIKVCLQVEEELLNQFKAIAHWERLSQRQLIESMIQQYASAKGESFVETAKKNYMQHSSC